jgi:hypothetical protein
LCEQNLMGAIFKTNSLSKQQCSNHTEGFRFVCQMASDGMLTHLEPEDYPPKWWGKGTESNLIRDTINKRPREAGDRVLLSALQTLRDTSSKQNQLNNLTVHGVAKVFDAARFMKRLYSARHEGKPCTVVSRSRVFDGLGAQISRRLLDNMTATILGCDIKCHPIQNSIKTSALYSNQADGSMLYCHRLARVSDFALKLSKGVADDNATLANTSERPKHLLDGLKCSRIPNFHAQIASIVPCTAGFNSKSGKVAQLSLSPVAHELADRFLNLPGSQKKLATDNLQNAFASTRSAHREGAKSRQKTCGYVDGFQTHDATTVIVAVHIRTGDNFVKDLIKTEICFVHWVVGVLESHIAAHPKKVHVHLYIELSKPSPDQNGQFEELSDLFVVHPNQQPDAAMATSMPGPKQSSPPWCGVPSTRIVGRLSGIPSPMGSYAPIDNVVLHHNGNALDDIMCLADADVLISGTPSSFVNIAATLSSGLLIYPQFPRSARTLRSKFEEATATFAKKMFYATKATSSPDEQFGATWQCPSFDNNPEELENMFLPVRNEAGVAPSSSKNVDLKQPLFRFATTHKMGTLSLKTLVHKYYTPGATFMGRFPPDGAAEMPTVVLTREVRAAVVSGYLYHKVGHECWIGPNELPTTMTQVQKRKNYVVSHQGYWLNRRNWRKSVTHVPYERSNNYNLCAMLAESDEITGLGIYAEFALNSFFDAAAKLKNKTYYSNPSTALFLCYEDLINPANQHEIINKIDKFLGFPPRPEATEIVPQKYEGGHSTSHDPILRERLLSEVDRIDVQWLGGALARINQMYSCGPPSSLGQ